jgi:thiamine kinase-like enzyme
VKYETIKGLAENKNLIEVRYIENGVTTTKELSLKDIQFSVILDGKKVFTTLEKTLNELIKEDKLIRLELLKLENELKQMIKVVADRVDLIQKTYIEEGEIV